MLPRLSSGLRDNLYLSKAERHNMNRVYSSEPFRTCNGRCSTLTSSPDRVLLRALMGPRPLPYQGCPPHWATGFEGIDFPGKA